MTDSGEFIYEARVICEVHARTASTAAGEEVLLHRTLSWRDHAAPGALASEVPPNEREEEEVVAEDEMRMEAGLVFWEVRWERGTGLPLTSKGADRVGWQDGAYSRGPLELMAEAETVAGDRGYFKPQTFELEQCLVRGGGHSRLRLRHTVAVTEGGEEIQLLSLSVFEEVWMGSTGMRSVRPHSHSLHNLGV